MNNEARLEIRLPTDLKAWLEAAAAEVGLTAAQYLRVLIIAEKTKSKKR